MSGEKVSSISTMSEQNERLLGFSDALFAIALTFLALDLGEIPRDVGTPDGPTTAEFLMENLRDYGVYFVTFLVVGVFWLRHHLIFRYVKRSSGSIVWLNIGILALVAALPYPAGMLAEAPHVPMALVALLVPLLVISLFLWFQWEVANKQGLIIPGLPRKTFVNIRAQLAISPVVLTVALLVAILAVRTENFELMRISEYLWLLLVLTPLIVGRIWKPAEKAYEVDLRDLSDDWQSYEDFIDKQEEESRSILARIRGGSDADRVKVLTDGVVAIAVTILALQLRPPEEVETTSDVLNSLQNAELWTYWITFVYIAFFWIGHVRIFSRVRGSNNVVLWLNLIFLMLIAFLPMPSALMSEAHTVPAAALYLFVLFVTSLSLALVGAYATYRLGFSGGFASKRARDIRTFRTVTLSASFLIAAVCVLLFNNAELANLVWIILVITTIIARRLDTDEKRLLTTST